MTMKNLVVVFSMGLACSVALGAADSRVVFRDCPKCDKRMKVSPDGKQMFVNESRVQGLNREAVAARAAKLLELAKPLPETDVKRPLMGWSSWNTFGVDISEAIILETAQAMVTSGLKAAGYRYINIDDGFFWGHKNGRLQFHPQRFPNGMKPTVDGIHALGLKAGIYSDAGADTCGSIWGGSGKDGKDKGGVGGGLFGHDAADCKLHFNELGFDFIKVDFCGGTKLALDEQSRYTEIRNAILATGRKDIRFNVCRWAFPGVWVMDVAESWRTTGDIRANWKSIRNIIAENLYLSAYCRPGHYNDMDMLEVGQLKGVLKTTFKAHGDSGITPEEEATHFGMWCMFSSPLLIGCDLRTIPDSTKALITNPYLLAMSQNDLGLQPYVAARDGDAYVLVKDADRKFGPARYVALYNPTDTERQLTMRADQLDLAGTIEVFDLVERADPGSFTTDVTVRVPAHGAKFYRLDAERRLDRRVYEAEDAYLTRYQELHDQAKMGTAHPMASKRASGGMVVGYLGNLETNDLIWQEVKVSQSGTYELELSYVPIENDRAFDLTVDGKKVARLAAPLKQNVVKHRVTFTEGVHSIRISNGLGWCPDFDCMRLTRVGE